ncbi:uncharacterized PE-PGRS family protein PE_PGRS36-like [Eleutherodactylus coqui]|uniref:uncharacterized PE-PGRS family protein PE_PGRS36-like n=1 Tax=Eleutherodactylus coqui TaxID=57060 RepID=UPI003462AC62
MSNVIRSGNDEQDSVRGQSCLEQSMYKRQNPSTQMLDLICAHMKFKDTPMKEGLIKAIKDLEDASGCSTKDLFGTSASPEQVAMDENGVLSNQMPTMKNMLKQCDLPLSVPILCVIRDNIVSEQTSKGEASQENKRITRSLLGGLLGGGGGSGGLLNGVLGGGGGSGGLLGGILGPKGLVGGVLGGGDGSGGLLNGVLGGGGGSGGLLGGILGPKGLVSGVLGGGDGSGGLLNGLLGGGSGGLLGGILGRQGLVNGLLGSGDGSEGLLGGLLCGSGGLINGLLGGGGGSRGPVRQGYQGTTGGGYQGQANLLESLLKPVLGLPGSLLSGGREGDGLLGGLLGTVGGITGGLL